MDNWTDDEKLFYHLFEQRFDQIAIKLEQILVSQYPPDQMVLLIQDLLRPVPQILALARQTIDNSNSDFAQQLINDIIDIQSVITMLELI